MTRRPGGSFPDPPPPARFRGRFLVGSAVPRRFTEASGPFRFPPAGVAAPADRDDLTLLVEWASSEGVPLVPRGAGTGMPGHNVGRGVVVSLENGFSRIGAVDQDARTVRVGPAAVASDVAGVASATELRLPPLPSSADRCTVGGMVANNAAGARSFLHGAIRDWVVDLEVVLGSGEVVVLGPDRPLPPDLAAVRSDLLDTVGPEPPGWPRVRKNSSGYALDRFLPTGDGAQLLVGSEGTLGIVTSILLRLTRKPERRAVLLAGLPTLDHLPRVASEAAGVGAVACEYLGRRILDMARLDEDPELGSLSRRSEALVLLEVEGTAAEVDEALSGLRGAVTRLGMPLLAARSEGARERLWDVRHRASPTIQAAAERGLRSVQFVEDSVVPRERLPAYVRGLREILADAATDAVVFGHAGDGNLHVNPLVDTTSPGWRDRVRSILEATVELVADLGGTLSGEHGDGRVRAPYLERIWGPETTAAFRRVKDALDPRGILNPGVVIPVPRQDPLDGLLVGADAVETR